MRLYLFCFHFYILQKSKKMKNKIKYFIITSNIQSQIMQFTINPVSYMLGAASVATVGCVVIKKIFNGVFQTKMDEYSKFICNNMFYFFKNCMYEITDEIQILKIDIHNLIKQQRKEIVINQNAETQTTKLKIDISVIQNHLDDIEIEDEEMPHNNNNHKDLENYNHEKIDHFIESDYEITH